MNAMTQIDTGAKVESALSVTLERQRAASYATALRRSPAGVAIS